MHRFLLGYDYDVSAVIFHFLWPTVKKYIEISFVSIPVFKELSALFVLTITFHEIYGGFNQKNQVHTKNVSTITPKMPKCQSSNKLQNTAHRIAKIMFPANKPFCQSGNLIYCTMVTSL